MVEKNTTYQEQIGTRIFNHFLRIFPPITKPEGFFDIDQKLIDNLQYLNNIYGVNNHSLVNNDATILELQEKLGNLSLKNIELNEKIEDIISSNQNLNSKFKLLEKPIFIKDKNVFKTINNFIQYQKDKNSFSEIVNEYIKIESKNRNSEIKKYNFESIKEKDRCLEISDKFVRIYYLSDLPHFVFAKNLFKLINLPLPMVLSYHIRGSNKGAMIKAARQRMSVLESFQNEKSKKGKTQDHEVAREIEEVGIFIDNLIHDYEKCFLVSVYTAIIADTKKELIEYDQKFQDETQDIEFTFNTYSYEQRKAYQSIMPLNQNIIKEEHLLQTSAVVNILPFLTRNLNDPSGIFFGVSHYNNSLLLIDLFKARNANMNIFGTSGSGKSVIAKLIITRLALRGIQNIIIDPEGEYCNLTNALGGQVIKFNRKNGIDPFSINLQNTDEIKDFIAVLKQFFAFFIQPARLDLAKLDRLLMKTYEGYDRPSFDKFLRILKQEASIDSQINFVDDILQLSEGSLGGLFNNYNKIDLNADIICFDLSNLNTDDKKVPATYLLGNIINKLIEKGDRRRMIYIDEAHKLLINEATTSFYIDLVKTARKRKVGVVSITQNPEDFKESNNSKTIITQAETTILLKQATASINYINRFNLFQITDRECIDLSSFAIGEALFIREKEHIYVDIFPFSSEKPLVFTS
jgi:ABC-type dipeptide/oligopeptide/nickel transport system ATPase component